MEWCAPERGRPGRPEMFSDAAIQFCLSLKVLFGLALRQTIRDGGSLLRRAGLDWPVPPKPEDRQSKGKDSRRLLRVSSGLGSWEGRVWA